MALYVSLDRNNRIWGKVKDAGAMVRPGIDCGVDTRRRPFLPALDLTERTRPLGPRSSTHCTPEAARSRSDQSFPSSTTQHDAQDLPNNDTHRAERRDENGGGERVRGKVGHFSNDHCEG